MILSGRQTKLFPARLKNFKDDKQPTTSGIAERLQSSSRSSVKEQRPDKVCSSLFNESEYDSPTHPQKSSTLSFSKRPMEEGSSLIAV